MLYQIEYLGKVVRKDIPSLSASAKILVKRAIEERLTVDPVAYGRPLHYALRGQRRLRVGNYRVIYTVNNDAHIVTVIAIGHRSKIYS